MDVDKIIKIYKNYKLRCSTILEMSKLYYKYEQKYIQDSHQEIRKELELKFKDVDFREFTKETLIKEFNFGPWDDDLVLCPIWTDGLIKEGTELYTISENMVIYKKGELSNDSRFGCFCYGFRTSDLRDYKLKNLTE